MASDREGIKTNIKLIIAYDGAKYFGWQNVSELPSIEGTLQAVIERLTLQKVQLNAASRTDAGVHAEGQVVSFAINGSDLTIEGLNALLPQDIRVLSLERVNDAFHATLNSKGKEYQYSICTRSVMSPFLKNYFWHYPRKLCLDSMREAANLLVGERDFASFANKGSVSYETTVRNLFKLEVVEESDGLFKINMAGDKFLYKMARNIAGTLAYVGAGKIGISDFKSILQSKDRTLAGVTAPCHGLCLKEVFY